MASWNVGKWWDATGMGRVEAENWGRAEWERVGPMDTTAGGWAMAGSVTLTSAFFHRLQPNVILCKSWGDPLTCLTSPHRTGRARPICTLTHILPAETIPAHLRLIQVQSCPYPVPALPTPIPGPFLSQLQSCPSSSLCPSL